jgi:hypothetical protein
MLERSKFMDLRPAIDAGILKLASGHTIHGTIAIQDLAGSWLTAVRSVLVDPERRLVLDDRSSEFAMQHLDIAEINNLSNRFADAEVGARLIARLPTFPAAPLDELLDLRADLNTSLARYRMATARFAKDLAMRDTGPDIRTEVEEYWATDVVGALADIREQMQDHGLVREVARSLSKDVRTLVLEGSAMYVGLNSLTSLNSWISSAAAVAAPAIQAAITGARKSHDGRLAARRHELYYLYAISQIRTQSHD